MCLVRENSLTMNALSTTLPMKTVSVSHHAPPLAHTPLFMKCPLTSRNASPNSHQHFHFYSPSFSLPARRNPQCFSPLSPPLPLLSKSLQMHNLLMTGNNFFEEGFQQVGRHPMGMDLQWICQVQTLCFEAVFQPHVWVAVNLLWDLLVAPQKDCPWSLGSQPQNSLNY